jgi:hypothetical protein
VTFVIVAANRKPATSNEESAALLNSLLAYTGKFMIEGDKFKSETDIIASGGNAIFGQSPFQFSNGRDIVARNGASSVPLGVP